jgi:peptidoglycan/LPS O-acetylase OafA/YrhL
MNGRNGMVTSIPEIGANGAPKSRLPSLTGMRIIAAGLVFFFHTYYENIFSSHRAQGVLGALFSQGGWTGVSFFFVLSGFVLTWSLPKRDSTTAFWRRRFFKIYPNHLVTFVAAALLLGLVTKQAFSARHAVLNLLLLHSWFPQFQVNNSFNDVTWSLSCEAFFYLCFPFLHRWISRIQPDRLWWWAGGVLALILIIPALTYAFPSQPQEPVVFLTQWQFWFCYFLPPVRMLEFVFGMLIAKVVLSGKRMPLSYPVALVFAVVMYAVAPLFPKPYPLVAVMVLPMGLLIGATAVADVQQRRTGMSNKVMVWLGEVSFAVYMWHRLVLVYGHQFLSGGKPLGTALGIGALLLMIAVVLLLSWALFTFVERPMMRRFARPRPHITVVPPKNDILRDAA